MFDQRRAISLVPLVCVVLFLGACGSGLGGSYAYGPSSADPSQPAGEAAPFQVATDPPPEAVPEAGWVRVAASASSPLFAYTDPGDLPQLKVAGDELKPLPLEHTHVKARLTGFIAEVEVSQTYTNPSTAPIEAVYVFPLPENSAVSHMKMVIGGRVIDATIKQRAEARRTYDQAKRSGYTAALLEQERPNVFTQSVANIEPGKKIDVVIRYVQDLTYDAGEYEFVFPMVVGPRFIQGAPLDRPASGSGVRADTAMVPDASRITPPILGKGERTGHDISLELVADASLVIGEVTTPTHDVAVRRPADGTLRLVLAEKKSIPNRDFVLRYRANGDKPKATLLTSGGASGGYFSLVVQPPTLDVDALVGRREIVFVVDISGSMSGQPIALCQAAMRDAIARLRPVDTFNLITFAGATGKVFEQARPANDANIRDALAFVDRIKAGGGTYMLDAVAASLTPDVGEGRHRYVFFLTDGFVGIEDQILAATHKFIAGIEGRGQRARVFGFGVGSSPNRALLDGISREGKGLTVYATNREHPARAVNQFYRYIDRSVLRDVTIDWGDLATTEMMPLEIPDLFASHPLIVHGRYRGGSGKSIVVRGKAGERAVEIPVTVGGRAPDDPRDVLGLLWARSKVTWLEGELWKSAGAEGEITKLGLEFQMVTRFTSFVAVDPTRKVSAGDPTTVVQPVEVPEGVNPVMAGALPGQPGLDASSQQAQVTLSREPMERQEHSVNEPEPVLASMPGVAPAERGLRGCNCRVGSEDDRSPRLGWLGFVFAAAALGGRVARRRGSRRRGPA